MPFFVPTSSVPLLHPQGPGVRSVCGGALRPPAAVSCLGPGEGGVCGNELQGPLPGAERPDPQRTDHLQQIPQRPHRAVRRHRPARREPGEREPTCLYPH